MSGAWAPDAIQYRRKKAMFYNGAIHMELGEIRSEVIALADLLDRLPPSGTMEKETPAGLSRLAWHIAKDIEAVQREIEEGGTR
jgi:hypothetical protein